MSPTQILTAVAALACVLALLAGARLLLGRAFLARVLLARLAPSLLQWRPNLRRGRLAVCETLALDQRRRLVLISLDGRELLLLTGGPADLLLDPMRPALPAGHAA